MNTTINNIKKELSVPFAKSVVSEKMQYLCTNSEYYKSFDASEAILGLFKYYFKKPISGLVDVGMQVHITITEDGQDKTKVTIEVVDNWGGTDDEFDVDSSNILMDEVTKSLSHVLSTDNSVLEETNKVVVAKEGDAKSMSGCLKGFLIIVGIAIFFAMIAM